MNVFRRTKLAAGAICVALTFTMIGANAAHADAGSPAKTGDSVGRFGNEVQPLSSPGGAWHHMYLTHADPRESWSSKFGTLHTQYTYGRDALAWSFDFSHLSDVGFRGKNIYVRFNVWVNTKAIKYYYVKNYEYTTKYIYHASLRGFRYNGKGKVRLFTPGNRAEIQLIAYNKYGYVQEQASVRIGKS